MSCRKDILAVTVASEDKEGIIHISTLLDQDVGSHALRDVLRDGDLTKVLLDILYVHPEIAGLAEFLGT